VHVLSSFVVVQHYCISLHINIVCNVFVSQGWMFALSGEILTMRVRKLAFKALLRQVFQSELFAISCNESSDAITLARARRSR